VSYQFAKLITSPESRLEIHDQVAAFHIKAYMKCKKSLFRGHPRTFNSYKLLQIVLILAHCEQTVRIIVAEIFFILC
jgi:hypothetical protein